MAFLLDISNKATTKDTVDLIIYTINKTSKEGFAPKLAQALNPTGSKLEFIKRLFDFVCKNVDYEMDPAGWEKVYTPAKLFQEAKGDCKKMTTAIAAVLKAAGIEPLLKVITYDGHNWAHIYVLAKINQRYYVLDPVNKKTFDSEIDHKKAAVYNLSGNFKIMPGTRLSILGKSDSKGFDEGINELCGDLDFTGNKMGAMLGMDDAGSHDETLKHFASKLDPSLSGMGKLHLLAKLQNIVHNVATGVQHVVTEAATSVKAAVKKIVHVGTEIAAAPMRAAFLGIVLLGKALENTPIKMHLAQKLAVAWQKDNGARLSAEWTKFGGKPDALKAAIIKGSGTSLAGIEPNGDFNISGMGIVTLAAIGAAMVAAAPILAVVHKILNDSGVIKPGTNEDAVLSTVTQAGIDAHNDDGSLPDAVKEKLKESGVTSIDDTGTKSGGSIDLSINTVIKSIFLICISPIVPGISFYILNVCCASIILLYTFTKINKYEIQF